MAENLQDSLEKAWKESLRLQREGQAYASLVLLGEIASVLRDQPANSSLARWRVRLRETQTTDYSYSQAIDSAKEKVARMKRILGVGTRFIYEEWVHLITTRVGLDLFLALLTERGVATDLDTSNVDRMFIEMACLPENRAEFASAQFACRRNWVNEIPIASDWLNELRPTQD